MRAVRSGFAYPWLAVIATIAAGGCGGGGSSQKPQNALDPLVCGATWKGIYTAGAGDRPPQAGDLLWQNGTLFVANSSTGYARIIAMPDAGGPSTSLYEGHVRGAWLEGDRLIYAQNYDLFGMPQAGGTPQAILHYGDTAYNTDGGDGLSNRVLDRAAIYWLRYSSAYGTQIWRHLRAGGEDSILASLGQNATTERSIEWVLGTRDELVLGMAPKSLTDLGASVPVVPKAGGQLRLLPLPLLESDSGSSAAMTMSNGGTLLWSKREVTTDPSTGARQSRSSMARADVSGSAPEPFDTTISPSARLLKAWPAGGGAWYVATAETPPTKPHTEVAAHLSVWFVQSDGVARRIGCDPMGGRPESLSAAADPAGIVTAGVATDGAFYLAVAYPTPQPWAIVRLDNPGATADATDLGGPGGAGGTSGASGEGGGAGGTSGCPSIGPTPLGGHTLVEFPIPGANPNPQTIAPAPDGSLWFNQTPGNLIRITTAGCMTKLPIDSGASQIVAGPDGNMWFTAGSTINRTAIDGSLLHRFPLLPGSQIPGRIAVGPDGNFWFSLFSPGAIGRITLDGTVTNFPTPSSSQVGSIAAGSDGGVWFTMLNGSRVGRIDPATGGMTEFPLPAGDRPGDIALGPDGNVWFIHYAPATFTIDRITPSGNITAFPFPAGGSPGSLAAGPDGTFWMTEADPNKIAQLDPATSVVTEFPLPSPRSSPYEITLGPDGNLWFVEAAGNRIGRLSP